VEDRPEGVGHAESAEEAVARSLLELPGENFLRRVVLLREVELIANPVVSAEGIELEPLEDAHVEVGVRAHTVAPCFAEILNRLALDVHASPFLARCDTE